MNSPKDAQYLLVSDREKRNFRKQVESIMLIEHLQTNRYFNDKEVNSLNHLKRDNKEDYIEKSKEEILELGIVRALGSMLRATTGKELIYLLSSSLRVMEHFIQFLSSSSPRLFLYLIYLLFLFNIILII